MACWWKFNHDCQVLTGQRIQTLANAIYKPHSVKKWEHRLGGHGLKMDALERHGSVKVLEMGSVRRVELKAYTSLRMSQNTQKLAALLKAQQTLSSSSSRPSTVARRRGCDGGRCTGWQTDVLWSVYEYRAHAGARRA